MVVFSLLGVRIIKYVTVAGPGFDLGGGLCQGPRGVEQIIENVDV